MQVLLEEGCEKSVSDATLLYVPPTSLSKTAVFSCSQQKEALSFEAIDGTV